MSDNLHLVDGSTDWSAGVDSSKASTVAGTANTNGLGRDQLAYLVNGILRDGIRPRTGFKFLKVLAGPGALYQGGFMYDPNTADPYLILSLSGSLYQVPCSAAADVDLSATFGLFNPPLEPLGHGIQAEMFGIWQAGDMVTLPLFWDGTTLRRSNGITGNKTRPNINELPAAGAMDYYMGRVWYVNGTDNANRTYSAGDIVQGAAGTAGFPYRLRDSVLCVTENPLCLAGDGFVVPDAAGAIRAIKHSANIDTTLGQGQLFIFTNKAIYTIDVPVKRTDWSSATADNNPQQKVVQITNGATSDRAIVSVNGDLFYQSYEPGIRSLIAAIRFFSQWSNTPISANLERLLDFQDRALMRYATGCSFGNRLLMGMRPRQVAAGVVHDAIVSLDFLPISSFGKHLTPCWEGHWEGLPVLQLFEGIFGGLQRVFAVVASDVDGSIQLWELTDFERQDVNQQGTKRVTMVIEFPAYNFDMPYQLKKLVSAELWLDKVLGTVDFKMEYRPDGENCWYFWHKWQTCSQASSCDDPLHPVCYPETPYRETHRTTITLPAPPLQCQVGMKRPAFFGYQFQCRLTITGWARVRGLLLHAEKKDKPLYKDMVCPTPAVAQRVTVTTETQILGEQGEGLLGEGGEEIIGE